MKKPTPLDPSRVTVSPAGNVRCRIVSAMLSSSFFSRSAKSGTLLGMSRVGIATAGFIPGFGRPAQALRATDRELRRDYGREADRRRMLARLAGPGRRAIRIPGRGGRAAL